MAAVFEKLAKILQLEEAQGHRNQAVAGGLERFIPTWREQASRLNETWPVEEITSLLQIYPHETQHGRKKIVAKIRRFLSPMKYPRPRPTPSKATTSAEKPLGLEDQVTSLTGIKEASAEKLSRLGIQTIRDLLYHFPHRYEDYSALKKINQLQYGEEATIIAIIWESVAKRTRSGKQLTTAILTDGTGTIQATWFNLPKYLAPQLQAGKKFVFSARVTQYSGRLALEQPSWEAVDEELIHTGRLVPVYPLTSGVGPRWLRRVIKGAVDRFAPSIADPLPPEIKESRGLVGRETAMQHIHFPSTLEMIRAARRRLAFDELLLIQLGVLRKRLEWKASPGRAIATDQGLLAPFLASLPFALTAAQERVLGEILKDMAATQPMRRLLQGEVGSGKTVVAAAAMLVATASGAQAAIMAPTEILAEQHYSTLQKLYQDRRMPSRLQLLIGSLSPRQKEEAYRQISNGEAQIIIGTHALIESDLQFHDLGLVIIDEQHRFGVRQRQTLREKGAQPHLLVMSATPIPRTLALTLYGDLDISIIDELPPGRQDISTRWLKPQEREEAYKFIRQEVRQGHQAFIICPLIEESEKIEAAAATVEYERLKDVFPELRLGLVHGRLATNEKDKVMRDFYSGRLHILVATPVVEVGIDVPNATVLLVEAAERFGLAQLHQFRGRIGRGMAPSTCLLLADSPSAAGEERLKIIESMHDGFRLAEEDLRMRGPGEFFGTRQSGLPTLRVAKLSDVQVLEEAREAAKQIFAQDPELTKQKHVLLAQEVTEFWQQASQPS